MDMLLFSRPIFLAAVISLIFFTNPSSSVSEVHSAYDILQTYNFPVGLLPKGITGYTLERGTGKFSASWNESCSFSLEGSYQLKYGSTIKGTISHGKLSNLQGVRVKLYFFWVDIVEVSRSGENLEFSVGIASAGFGVENFVESPQCGCGFDCHTSEARKIRRGASALLSSD